MQAWTVQDLQKTTWFSDLVNRVQAEFDQIAAQDHHEVPDLLREHDDLQKLLRGWSQSLGRPDLDPSVRAALELEYANAIARQKELELLMQQGMARQEQIQKVINPQHVVDCLNRLHEILAKRNPTRAHLELTQHIENIYCYRDGHIRVRTCRLGAMPGAIDLLAKATTVGSELSPGSTETSAGRQRRLARRRVESVDDHSDGLCELAAVGSDVHRFAGLAPAWFEEDELHIPHRKSWAEAHAGEVARERAKGMTIDKLARYFGKTPPTILKAMRYAEQLDPNVASLPRKMIRRWADNHEDEVLALREKGMSILQIARSLGKSEPTIRITLQQAKAKVSQPAEQAKKPESAPGDGSSGSRAI